MNYNPQRIGRKFLLAFLFPILASVHLYGQAAVNMTFQNFAQTSTTTYSFDVYITNVQSANTLQLRSFQWGLNTTGWTSGTFTNTLAYVAGSRDALFPASSPAYSLASQAKTSTGLTPMVNFTHLRLTSGSIPTGSEPILQPNVPFKIGSFTVTVNNASVWGTNYNPFTPPVFGTGVVQAIQTLVATGYSQALVNVLVNGSSTITSYSAANSMLSTSMTPSPSGAAPFLLNGCAYTSSSTNATACNTYTWANNGQTYTTGGTYTYTSLIGAGPCINTATLNLTINTAPAAPTGLACYQTASFNNNTCSWVVTGAQPAQPTLACYETATFNSSTCSWEVFGTQPAAPTGLACYQTATFNSSNCSWDVTGTQPAAPTGLACYETATFNGNTCSWDVTGTQPAAPTGLACYETATFNGNTCSWDVFGIQPSAPALFCYETASFNSNTCSWDVTGTQPAAPTGLACYVTASFNNNTCSWDVTGTQPAPPTGLTCYQTATFNSNTCSWDVTGTQPAPPTGLACYQTASWNASTCQYDITGEPYPVINTTATICSGDAYVWPITGQSYDTSGTYSGTFLNSYGCIQQANLTLQINGYNSNTSSTQTACDTYTWPINGQTYTLSGLYTHTSQNATGCVHTNYLNLLISASTSSIQSVSACDTYSWPLNAQTYTSSGTYITTTQNAAGCNNIATLNLQISQTSTVTQTVNAVGSYTWNLSGQTYTSSGTYTASSMNAGGCPQSNNLILQISSANPTVLYTLNNMQQTGANQFAFDVWITNTGNVPLNAISYSFGLNCSSNLGTLSMAYVSGSKDALFNVINTYNTSATLKSSGSNNYYHLRMTSSQAASGSQPMLLAGSTYKLGRFVVNSTQNWSALSNPFLPPVGAPIQVTTQSGYTQCVLYTLINGSTTSYSLFGTTNTPVGNSLNKLSAVMMPVPASATPFLLNAGCVNTSSSVSQSVCNSYTWHGNTYTSSGIYTQASLIGNGPCYQVDSLQLTILPSTQNINTVTACDTYNWAINGQTYTTSGSYTYTSTNTLGCLHTETLNLTINNSSNTSASQIACDSYTWPLNGQTYTSSGTYSSTYMNTAGCLHTDHLNLSMNYATGNQSNVVVCDTYQWSNNGQTYTTSGSYLHTNINAAGCTHTDTLNLVVNNSTYATESATACDSYAWNVSGLSYTSTGLYSATSMNAMSCTHTVDLVLTVNYSSVANESATACDSYTWPANGQSYSVGGTYIHTSVNASGCLHTTTLNLSVNNSTSIFFNETACDSYTWPVNGQSYTTGGTYIHTSLNASGCTNIATLNLTINNSSNSSTTETACDSYTWSANGQSYTAGGIYTYTSLNTSGCTNTATLNLTINNSSSTSIYETACDLYTWNLNGQTFTTSGVYTLTNLNGYNCIQTEILYVTITPSTSSTSTVSACDSYFWHGATYTSSGTYTNLNACHTDVLNLTIYNSSASSIVATACDVYLWAANSQLYNAGGIYTNTSLNADGCVYTSTLNLTINNNTSSSSSATACDSYFWSLHGQTYTISGQYTVTGTNAAGCLQTDILNLTLNANTTLSVSQTACDAYVWNGNTYTSSGIYTYSSLNATGCTQTDTLYLTINYSTSQSTTQTACDSYLWAMNGQIYTNTGTYTTSTMNAYGCADNHTLNLTIVNSSSHTTTQHACDLYVWNAQTLTASGVYTLTSQNSFGCLHEEILILQFDTNTSTTQSASTCDVYTWNLTGQTYSNTGIYTHTGTNASGCLQTDILNLQVWGTTTDTLQVTECFSYWWTSTSMAYAQSGMYTHSQLNAQGCTQTQVLQLTLLGNASTACAAQQARKSIPYQAALRDASGSVLSSQTVSLRFSISNTLNGAPIYQETHDITSTSLGLCHVRIGTGNSVGGGLWDTIRWDIGSKYLQVEMDTMIGSGNYIDLGIQQLSSVPYALYAENGLPVGQTSGEMLYWDGGSWVPIPSGAEGQTLTYCNGKPHWGPCPTFASSPANSVSIPTIGAPYQGGVVAYILQPGDYGYDPQVIHGLVAAVTDLPATVWGCNGQYITTGTSMGTGFSNTQQIVTTCNMPNAASQSAGSQVYGYNDWYLPSRDELQKLYQNRLQIGGFQGALYWSSSSYNNTQAWQLDFSTGMPSLGATSNSYLVRIVRSF